MTMLTPSSMAKIEMNFPSASTDVASHTHQLRPPRSPYAVGFQRARLGNAKSWMWTASIPSTPTPRSTSSDLIRGEVFVASDSSVHAATHAS